MQKLIANLRLLFPYLLGVGFSFELDEAKFVDQFVDIWRNESNITIADGSYRLTFSAAGGSWTVTGSGRGAEGDKATIRVIELLTMTERPKSFPNWRVWLFLEGRGVTISESLWRSEYRPLGSIVGVYTLQEAEGRSVLTLVGLWAKQVLTTEQINFLANLPEN